MSLFYRINRGIREGVRAARSAPDMKLAAKQLDMMISSGVLPVMDQNASSRQDATVEEKEASSKLDVRHTDRDLTLSLAYGGLRSFFSRHTLNRIPDYGDPSRDVWLDGFWRTEPILAGAVYSMSAKMSALSWIVSGPRLRATKTAQLLARAAHMGGQDWGGFMSPTAQDWYATNNGVFWETAREAIGNVGIINTLAGNLSDIGHIDSLCCTLTGNVDSPMQYVSEEMGQQLRFIDGEFIHFASLPSARERHLGIGFCAVDRAYRAAKLLIGLHDYDEEKLSNLPPEGIAAVTGLTMTEFKDALVMWKLERERDHSLTFPQVLWLIGSQPNTEVSVNIQSFSSIPESFDRDKVMSHYISTLALCFGVDAREFWPISSGSLGTASESEIQHLKAKGKGPGEFISTTERMINGELPAGVDFAFDTQDIEEDQNAATVAKAWVDVYYPLYQGTPAGGGGAQPVGKQAPQRTQDTQAPKPPKKGMTDNQQPAPAQDKPGGFPSGMPGNFGAPQVEAILTKDQIIRLLVDKRVLPEYLINDDRVSVYDSEVHLRKENPEDDARFVWKSGVLKEVRLPPIIIYSHNLPLDPGGSIISDALEIQPSDGEKAVMEYLKQKEGEVFAASRDIQGRPINEEEVVRGARVTQNTIRDEIARWKAHPILSKYVPTDEEIQKLLGG